MKWKELNRRHQLKGNCVTLPILTHGLNTDISRAFSFGTTPAGVTLVASDGRWSVGNDGNCKYSCGKQFSESLCHENLVKNFLATVFYSPDTLGMFCASDFGRLSSIISRITLQVLKYLVQAEKCGKFEAFETPNVRCITLTSWNTAE